MITSPEFYKSVLENIEEGIFVCDSNDNIIYTNRAIEKLAGIPVDQIIGKNILKDFPKETVNSFSNHYLKAKKSTAPIWVELKMVTPGGMNVWQNGWIIPIYGKEGQFEGIIITVRDITESKTLELYLEENEHKLAWIFQNAPVGIALVSVNRKIEFVNQTICKLLNYKKTDLIGKEVKILYNSEDEYKRIGAYKYNELRKKNNAVVETRFLRSDGSFVDVQLNSSFVEKENPEAGIISVITDLSELKKLYKSFEDSKEKYKLLIENQNDIVVKINSEHQLLYVNPNYCKTFGVQEKEIIGKSFFPLVHKDDQKTVKESIKKIYSPPYKTYHEERARTVNGWRWFGWSLRGIVLDGMVNEIIAVGRDITDQKNAIIALKESEKKFKTIIEYSTDAIFLVNKKGEYVYANDAASKMLGYSKDELLRLNIIDIGSQDSGGERFQKVISEGHIFEKFELKRKDGEIIKAELDAILLPNGLVYGRCRNITLEHQRQIDLKQSETKYRSVLETSFDGFWINDKKGNFLEVNPAYCKMIGYSKQELLKMSISDIEAIESADEVKSHIKNVFKEGFDQFRTKHRTKAGEIIDVEMSVQYNPDTDNNFAFVKDISTQLKAEQALLESEEKYRSTYDNAPLAFQSLNEDGFIRDVNPTWLKTLGYNRNEVMGKWFGDFLHPDYVNHFKINFPAFKKRGSVSDVQFKMKKKDNSCIHVSFEGCIAYTPEGKFKQTYCTFKDITEAKIAERALIESEEKYRALVENTGAGTGYFDLEGNVIHFNTRAAKLMGGTPDDYIGKNIVKLYGDKDGGIYLERIKKASISETSQDYEDKVALPVGTFWYLSTYTRVKNADGKVTGVQVISKDITDRKEMEIEIKEHQNRLEEKVLQRTKELEEKNKELEEKNKELEEYNQLFVGREFRIKELKDKIEELQKKKANS